MTRFQKGFCVILCLCFFGVLAVMPEPFSSFGNLYRQLPLYRYLESAARREEAREDVETSELIAKNNKAYLAKMVGKENEEASVREKVSVREETAAQEEMAAQEETTVQEEATVQEEVSPQEEVTVRAETEAAQTEQESQEVQTEPDGIAAEDMEVQTEPDSAAVSEAAETEITSVSAEDTASQAASAPIQAQPNPIIDLSTEKLSDLNYVLNNFYVTDENTTADAAPIDAVKFLSQDMTMKQDAAEPQILIYHSHSQETFADSREGEPEDTVVGVGNYLTELLTENYGYNVIHVTETFDLENGVLDRSGAYDNARQYVEQVLAENPSIEVVIDLHRDGVPEGRRLVTEINGKDTAQIMFYNGLSYTLSAGEVTYLPNPYIEDNLAFSFQLEYQAALYYPKFYRCIYLAGLRYNLHLRPKAILLEAGAQTNTVQEVKNAMEPFADILNKVLSGG